VIVERRGENDKKTKRGAYEESSRMRSRGERDVGGVAEKDCH
jgi:hypothetical protein